MTYNLTVKWIDLISVMAEMAPFIFAPISCKHLAYRVHHTK